MIQITTKFDAERWGDYAKHLVFSTGGSVEAYVQDLGSILAQHPERVFIVSAFDGDELVGFLIAVNQETSVFISQGWSKPGNSWTVADNLFARVTLWALGLGKTKIHAHTSRSTEALYQRFGLVEIAKVVEHRIPNSLLLKLVDCVKDK